jgi:hypothetical protein
VDIALNYNDWPHPADFVMPRESNESKEYTVEVFTAGSKSDEGVGSGIVMFINNIYVCNTEISTRNISWGVKATGA